MLTKQAEEKLAQEYYFLGLQLAAQEVGLVKEANIKNISKKAVKEYLALFGGLGGGVAASELLSRLGLSSNVMGGVTDFMVGAPLMVGGISGAHQLSRKGLDKLIK